MVSLYIETEPSQNNLNEELIDYWIIEIVFGPKHKTYIPFGIAESSS